MDQETQTYYDNYFNLFLTDGWKQLMQDFGNNAVQINSVEAVKDADDMHFRKGQLNVLAHLINMENIVSTNYEEANKSEDDD
jgi:hypothetical protein|tara:strand:+ start:241 stop:486 length:246 start_codon:yes stop_codon:yes gene_type:complete